MFDDNLYFCIIITVVLLMVIYGRPSKTSDYLIEYDNTQFKYLEKLYFVDKQIENSKITDNKIIIDKFGSIEEITNKLNNCEKFIPNIVSIYNITINPRSFFDSNKYINSTKIMIIKIINDLIDIQQIKLLVNKNFECNENNLCGNYGYFYSLDKKISIVNIYPIFNDTDKVINLTIYVIKKPFWHI